jgi:hypothetical protein
MSKCPLTLLRGEAAAAMRGVGVVAVREKNSALGARFHILGCRNQPTAYRSTYICIHRWERI